MSETLDKLQNRILSDAQLKADEIIRDSQAKSEQILAEAQQKAQKEVEASCLMKRTGSSKMWSRWSRRSCPV